MALLEKLFSKITFKNYPDTSTPIDADNLNKMTDAIDGIDDRVVDIGDNLDKWNIPNTNILIASDSDNNNVLMVSTDVYSDWNKPCRVHQTSSGSALNGMPPLFPQGVGFVGIRYVDYFNAQNIQIRLQEISPVQGRWWTRKYNGTSWGNWSSDSLGKMHSSAGTFRTPVMFNTNVTFTDGLGVVDATEYLEKIGLENITGACFAMLRGSTTSSTYSVKKSGANNTTKEISIVVSNDAGTLFSGTADVSIIFTAY